MILEIAKYSLFLVGLLMATGGIIGYKKAKSKASLIAGIASCVLLDICFFLSFSLPVIAIISALALLVCLDIVFLVRLMKTRVIMPVGMLLLICLIEQGVLIAGLLNLS